MQAKFQVLVGLFLSYSSVCFIWNHGIVQLLCWNQIFWVWFEDQFFIEEAEKSLLLPLHLSQFKWFENAMVKMLQFLL